ncbi:MAG: TonB-dependent receptor plug domain-containing protein [Gemmatimonadaceae bacterium]
MRRNFPHFRGCLLGAVALLSRPILGNAQSAAGVPPPLDTSATIAVQTGAVLTSATLAPGLARTVPFVMGRLTTEDMPVLSTTSPLGSIAGKIAGVTVTRASGAPGSDFNVVLRTAFSALASSPPAMVVDGVWLNAAHPFASQDIESAEIATVEVLKGPIAAALYGARGASGVIVITTNRGLSVPLGKTQFSLRNEIGADYVGDWPEAPQAHQYRVNAVGQYINAAGAVVSRANRISQANGIMENRYIDPTYNHADQFFRLGLFNTQTVSLRQNRSATNFNLSYARNQQPGAMPFSDGYARQTVRMNADYRATSWARASVSASHARSTEDPSSASVGSLLFIDPDVNLRAADPTGVFQYTQIPGGDGQVNPFSQQLFPHAQIERNRTLLNANVTVQPLAFLYFDAAGAYDRGNRHLSRLVPRGTTTLNGQSTSAGFLQITNDTSASSLVQGGATAQKRFGALQSRLSLRAESQHQSNALFDSTGNQLNPNNIPLVVGRSYLNIKGRTTAAIANLGLEFADKYVVDALVRRERSSLRSVDGPLDVFTRASAAWLMNQERWLPFSGFPLLKLHVAMGTAETHNYNIIRYVGPDAPATYTDSPATKATESEIGVEIVPRNRFRASFAYAASKLKRVPYGLGVIPCIVCVDGNSIPGSDFSGHILEAALQASVLQRTNGLHWDMAIVADRRRNVLTKSYRTCFTNDLQRVCDDTDVNAMFGQHLVRTRNELVRVETSSLGVFDINDDGYVVAVGAGNSWRDGKSKNLWGTIVAVDGRSYAWGLPILARTTDGLPSESPIGNANSDLQFGFQNTVRYRGFQFYTQLTGQFGGDIYNNVKQTLYATGNDTDVDQSAKADELRKPRSYYRAAANNNANYLQNFVESAAHASLAEASVSYEFNAGTTGVLRRIGASLLRVDLIGRNLFTLTGYSGVDPLGTTPNSRVENFGYPRTRTFTLATGIVF